MQVGGTTYLSYPLWLPSVHVSHTGTRCLEPMHSDMTYQKLNQQLTFEIKLLLQSLRYLYLTIILLHISVRQDFTRGVRTMCHRLSGLDNKLIFSQFQSLDQGIIRNLVEVLLSLCLHNIPIQLLILVCYHTSCVTIGYGPII